MMLTVTVVLAIQELFLIYDIDCYLYHILKIIVKVT